MIYGKLPSVFLNVLASEKEGSTNSVIAAYILGHLDDIQDIGISELASRCHVANSSVSRFVKEVGLRDFVELKDLIKTTSLVYEREASLNAYLDHLVTALSELKSINEEELIRLCVNMKHYQRVATFGLLKAELAAMNLADDMMMLGRNIYTNVAYSEQMRYILNSDEEDMIIIFSYTASYFEYARLRAERKKLYKPYIVLITSRQEIYPDYIDQVVDFSSDESRTAHPYTLMAVGSLITQTYARLHDK